MDWRIARASLIGGNCTRVASVMGCSAREIDGIEKAKNQDRILIGRLADLYRELAKDPTLQFSRDDKAYARSRVEEFFQTIADPANLYDKRLAQIMYFALSDGLKFEDVDALMRWPKGRLWETLRKRRRLDPEDYSRVIIRLGGTPIMK